MKKTVFIVFMLASASFATAQVRVFTPENAKMGDSIDVVGYTVGYDMAFFKGKGWQKGTPLHEQTRMDIGSKTAHFYSYKVFQGDSTAYAEMTKGKYVNFRTGQINVETFTDYPSNGQYSMTDLIGLDRYLLQEQMPIADWELCPDSSATVLGYSCRMAKATFLGREWSAWYAEDIPLDNGPWLLRGLPGLILRAYTADSLFRFEANGIEKGNGTRHIYYRGGKSEELNRKSLMSLYERFYADPVGYITNAPNVKVTVKDESGNEIQEPKDVEYFLLDATLQKQ